MQDDNRRKVNPNIIGYMYIHDGIVIKVLKDSWCVDHNHVADLFSGYISFWRRPNGKWESIMGDGDRIVYYERAREFDRVYREYMSVILEN